MRFLTASGGIVRGGFLTRPVALVAVLMFVGISCTSNFAKADEGGLGFWLPGLFGSFAAAPQVQVAEADQPSGRYLHPQQLR
jgi:hypothetical protein